MIIKKSKKKEWIIMGKYFGIDGVCGVVNKELIFELVFKIGCFGGYVLIKDIDCLKVIIGCDICVFGYMLEGVLVVGLLLIGVEVMCFGVIFILGVVYLIKVLDV